jgi:replicative DNA helicase
MAVSERNGAHVGAVPVPPQNLDAEEYVLGAMMLSAGAIAAVAELLSAGDFYRESHGKIFRAATDMYGRGEPVDPLTLAHDLKKRGELAEIGGSERIRDIATLAPAAGAAAHHARIVRDTAIMRGLARVGSQINQLGQDERGAPEELLSRAELMLYELAQRGLPGEVTLLKDTLGDTFARISELYESGADVTGLASGFIDLDRITAGFQPGNLVVLAARPAMGKSALGLNIAASVALSSQRPCAIFSLEMSRQEVAQRLLCADAKIDAHKVRTGKLAKDDWPRLVAACATLEKAPIYVDDTAGLSIVELRARLQTLKRREPNLAVAVVDYLQLMTIGGNAESRLQEVSAVSRGLKQLAKDLDIPIIALSQLSRAVEQRQDKRPVLADLRESGGIEQDADLVMFIYRDEYYNKDSEDQGLAEVIIAKHRHGPTDTVKLSFMKRYARFASHAA